MEIERKYLVSTPPAGYQNWPFHQIEQAYLCTSPTVRIRREDDTYYMTYKGSGLLAREEYNLPLTKEAYAHLLAKADGRILTKKRYLLPLRNAYGAARDMDSGTASDAADPGTASDAVASQTDTADSVSSSSGRDSAILDRRPAGAMELTVEMDVFEGAYEGLILAEVEFPTEEAALAFTPPDWFGRDVTFTGEYSNSRLASFSENGLI